MHFGATLRLLRIESGLSLRDLARRLGVSSAYLSRVENGVDAVPTSERLEVLARELGLPATLLMELAHRVSPLVVDYVERVPDAGALFLEIAHRRLNGKEIARLRALLDQHFPQRMERGGALRSNLAELLSPERIVVRLSGSELEDALDVAAGRLAAAVPGTTAAALASVLKNGESEVSSAIGSGVAVPRAYVAGAGSTAALVTLARPLRYDTPDGKPLRVVIALAGTRTTGDLAHRLAHIARLAVRGLADQLATASSASQILSRLASLEGPR